MSIDLYKYAAQNNLRFPSRAGNLMVEDLFDLPLTSERGASLDDTAKKVNADLKSVTEESFVATSTSPVKAKLEIMLEIVKDVIATKQAENAAALAKKDRADRRKKILDAMAAKQDQKLSEATLEQLEAELAALDE